MASSPRDDFVDTLASVDCPFQSMPNPIIDVPECVPVPQKEEDDEEANFTSTKIKRELGFEKQTAQIAVEQML